ncbi:MAG: Holliday junction resolvase-like protein [Spirochaetota bacterium]
MELAQIQLIIVCFAAVVLSLVFFKLGAALGSLRKDREWLSQMKRIRRDIADSSRSVIRGQVSEQLSPYLPGFPFDPASCKFIGSPVDFIVFHKLQDPNERAVVLVEVKTGGARLNENELLVLDAVKSGRVYFYEYRPDRIPSEKTGGPVNTARRW